MTLAKLSHYEVGRQDTAESISRGYGMSWRAIRDIPANQHLRHRLPDTGKVDSGLLLSIPPHPGRLVRERLNTLHRLRPQVLAHFDQFSHRADVELKPLLLASSSPSESAEVRATMAVFEQAASTDLMALAALANTLADLAVAMALTHVATHADRQVTPVGEPLRGMYWILSADQYRAWHQLWAFSAWCGRWRGGSGEDAWSSLQQLVNTIRSIAVQGVDVRIRTDQQLERELVSEFRQN